jgi:hypothetical protein
MKKVLHGLLWVVLTSTLLATSEAAITPEARPSRNEKAEAVMTKFHVQSEIQVRVVNICEWSPIKNFFIIP